MNYATTLIPILLLSLGCDDASKDSIDTTPVTDQSDGDGDGHTAADGDCDDSDAAISPDAEEVCDGIDNNCNGSTDEGLLVSWYTDTDGDGYGLTESLEDGCEAPEGTAAVGEDCDDDDSAINPGAAEVCDGIDNDCNG